MNIKAKFFRKRQGIFIDNQYNENYGDEFEKNKNRKKSWMWICFKWIVYAVAALIIIVVAYRLIDTGMPNDLKNYIIKSDKIEKAYANLKADFKIYKIDVRNSFSMGDALFVDNVYYLESVENFQLTLRCKNSKLEQMFEDNPAYPFRYYLKVSSVNNDLVSDSIDSTVDEETDYILDYVILQPMAENTFGKEGRYRYFVLSFDDVQIAYAKTKVELYVTRNKTDGNYEFDEDDYVGRFTLFDINMPKSKIQAKKFWSGIKY